MKRISLICTLVLTLCLLVHHTTFAGVIVGKVIQIADGDTITVRDQSKQKHKVRLYGIDCPESGQEYGREAKYHAARLTVGKEARVTQYARDRYGRVVGVVMVDGVNVNQSLIENGYAWKYRKYCKEPFCADWRDLEKKAKDSKRGLWTDDSPVAPWDWRRGRREGKSAASIVLPGTSGGSFVGIAYSGNVNSRVFHDADCKHFDCKNCLESFADRRQALKKGYRPCGICKP